MSKDKQRRRNRQQRRIKIRTGGGRGNRREKCETRKGRIKKEKERGSEEKNLGIKRIDEEKKKEVMEKRD